MIKELIDKHGIELVVFFSIAAVLWLVAFFWILKSDSRRITKLSLLALIVMMPPVGVGYPIVRYFSRKAAQDIASGKAREGAERVVKDIGFMGRIIGRLFGWLLKK